MAEKERQPEQVGQEFKELQGVETQETDFTDCRFVECDVSGLHFSGILDRCMFEECNLSLTSFEKAKLQGVKFVKCKLQGIDFTRCNDLGLSVGFNECLIRSCNFNFMELKKTEFQHCEISETDFVGCDLTQSSFAHSVLHSVTFHETKLGKADFTDAQGYNINPLTNDIKGAKFSLPEAVSLLHSMGIKLSQ